MTAPVTVTPSDKAIASKVAQSRVGKRDNGIAYGAAVEAAALSRRAAEAASSERVAELVEALAEIERRCADFERINLGGKSPAAKAIGTIRNCAAIARAKATPDA